MNTPLIIILVVLFIIADIIILRWIFSRKKTAPALVAYATDCGWQHEDLAPGLQNGPSTRLSDADWQMTIAYRTKSRSTARLVWTAPVAAGAAYAIAPPLAQHMIKMIESAPPAAADTVLDQVLGNALPHVTHLPDGLTLQKDTFNDGRGILLAPDATVGRQLYDSTALRSLQSALPRTSGLTIVRSPKEIELAIEIETDNPEHLKDLVTGGIALQQVA